MVKTKIIETTEDDEKGTPIFTGGAAWWDKLPNTLPVCCGRGESIKITY